MVPRPTPHPDRTFAGAARSRTTPPVVVMPEISAFMADVVSAEDADAARAAIDAAAVSELDVGRWNDLTLVSDFTTGSSSAVDITGLAFTPDANTDYEFYAVLFARTTNAAIGPRPGLAWPTGLTDGVATLRMPATTATMQIVSGNIAAAVLLASSVLPDATNSWPVVVEGFFRAGASPSGAFKLQVASSTALTDVTIKAGSLFRYRGLA